MGLAITMRLIVIFFAGWWLPCVATTVADCVPGSAFCQEQDTYATNMLQTDLSRKQAFSKTGAQSIDPGHLEPDAPNNNQCCDVYIDGQTKTKVPRTVLLSGFPREMLTAIPLASHPDVKINGTHVFVPSKASLFGKFTRSTHVDDVYEYGTSETKWFTNPMSIFPDIATGISEKLTILQTNRPQPTVSADRIRKLRKERSSITDMIAKSMNKIRIAMTFIYTIQANMVRQLTSSGMDTAHLARLHRMVHANPKPTDFILERKNKLMENMTRQMGLAGQDVISVALNCIHWQSRQDMSANLDGVWLPLDKMQLAVRANTVYSPHRTLEYSAGIGVITYDQARNELLIHNHASSLWRAFDLEQPERRAAFILGPVDGQSLDGYEGGQVPEDGRIQSYVPNRASRMLWNIISSIPVDYEYLYQDPAELCPPEKFARLAEEARDMDLMDVATGKATTAETAALVMHLVDVLDCGFNLMQSYPKDANGMELIENIAYGHGLMETPSAQRLELISSWSSSFK